MKWIRRVVLLVLGVVLLAVFLAAMPGIPRKDVLECGLPDGSKFVLTARYDWYPLARVLPEAAERLNQGPWSVEYQEDQRPFKTFKSEAPATVHFLSDASVDLRNACLYVGKIDHHPIVATSYLAQNGEWFSRDALPWKKLAVPAAVDTRSEPLKSDLERAGLLGAGFALIVPQGNRLIYEQSLLQNSQGYTYDPYIEGVYQSISSDGGKTWSKPVITTKAIIFEMGKSWLDQCFVARPIRINGRQIKPDFPAPCPDRSK